MKILIASLPSDGGDAELVQAKVLLYCPAATTEILREYSFTVVAAYAISHGFNAIARNVSDFKSDYLIAETTLKDAGVWVSWGHGGNSHIYVGNPPRLVDNAIGVGYGALGVNVGSYGPALDFFVNGIANESQACGAVAGRIGQILIDNPTWSFDNARYFLRKKSSFFPTWQSDGAYGAVSLTARDYVKLDYWTPAAPTATVVRNGTKAIVDVTPQSDADRFFVYRCDSWNGTYEEIGEVASGTFEDSGLNNSSAYFYKVKSYNSSSQQFSDFSDMIAVEAIGGTPAMMLTMAAL